MFLQITTIPSLLVPKEFVALVKEVCLSAFVDDGHLIATDTCGTKIRICAMPSIFSVEFGQHHEAQDFGKKRHRSWFP